MWRVIQPINTVKKNEILRLSGQLLLRKSSNTPQPPPSQVPKKSPELSVEKLDAAPQRSGLKRTRGFLWKVVGATLLGYVGLGGVVGYCWYSKEFRDYVEQNVPRSAELLAILFHNYLPPPPYEQSDKELTLRDILLSEDKKTVDKSKKDVKHDSQTTSKSLDNSTPALPSSATPTPTPPPAPLPVPSKTDLKKQQQEQRQAALKEKEKEEAAQNSALEVILSTNLQAAKKVAEDAREAQQKAVQATRTHMEKLRQAMDAPEKEANTEGLWSEVTQAAEWRVSAVLAARQASDNAREELEKLRAAVKDGRSNQVTKRNKLLTSTEEQLNKLNSSLTKATAELSKAESDANLVSEYRDVVRRGRDQFRKEVESIIPDVKLGKGQGGKMSEDDLNALIAHAHRRIEQLQKQLAEQQTLERQRLELALSKQKQEDDKLTDERLTEEKQLFQDQLTVEKAKWEADAHVEFEAELRRELGRQAAAHSDHLASVLRVQEQELEQKYATDLRFQLMRQGDTFHAQVAKWVARLRGIEAAVEGRAALEKQGLQAQELWVACQTLLAAIVNGSGNVDSPKKPLSNEAAAVVKASNNHPFVSVVVSSLPDEAVKQGIYTEEALTKRFRRVQQVCRRVAMIDETGGTLFRYFLSYLQSLVIFSRAKALTEDDVVNADSLTTFDILDNAHSALLAGKLELALRLMNQLRGEPRKVAADWIRDARLLLEAQQASQTLLAFTAASGVGAIY